MNKYSLGIDIGSSSIKVSLMDIKSGECIAASTNPSIEMPIYAAKTGWAEQDPEMWWKYVVKGIEAVSKPKSLMSDVACIGITYQMHGLVLVDKDYKPLRKSIIWCDSRAVEIGEKAMKEIGRDVCLDRNLNFPGNFTASKLAWVKENEPETYAKIYKVMLPGDYIAMKLSQNASTTFSGLSEGILWDFKDEAFSDLVSDTYGFSRNLFCDTKPSIGIAAKTDKNIEMIYGIPEGTPISYRAGDQPNNAFSLNVMEAGEIAATGGTSGVVYGVIDVPNPDKKSRVNTFLHVNHSKSDPHYGVLLCINGTGIANSWVKHNIAPNMSYEQMNNVAADIPAGSDGVIILPFGNGAERVLENKFTGFNISGLDLNRHSKANIIRAVQEGIAFSFRYGIDIMHEMGLKPKVIRAGKANMFLSDVFLSTLASVCDIKIELYNTDGSLGAARGAALGAGFYKDRKEAFSSLKLLETIEPDKNIKEVLSKSYDMWKRELLAQLNK